MIDKLLKCRVVHEIFATAIAISIGVTAIIVVTMIQAIINGGTVSVSINKYGEGTIEIIVVSISLLISLFALATARRNPWKS